MKRLALLLCLLAMPALAADIRLFEVGSIQKIRQDREGRPFILGFWSITCAHCPHELKILGELKQRYPKLEIVLVAADTPAERPALAEAAKRYGLGGVEQWVFADSIPERLRYEIDRRWWGELPRTYFFDGKQGVEAVSGVVPEARLVDWVNRMETTPSASPPR